MHTIHACARVHTHKHTHSTMETEDRLVIMKVVTKSKRGPECNYQKEKESIICFLLGSITFCSLCFPNVSHTQL